MAQITIEEIYRGEKYDVMGAVMTDYIEHGKPNDCGEKTWLELLIVKHAIDAAHKMEQEGDSVSTMIDNGSPSFCVRGGQHDND